MSDRTEIDVNREDNPKMKEIFDILLLAGYFRIRIPSINSFDKIIGGLTWCIICSNFDVDIEYNEEMNLGQKIKLAEKICVSLKKMKCPHDLQPHQIQGLDFSKIFSVIKWLIQFVYQTRDLRQDFNREMSNFVGKKVYKYFEIKDRKDQATIKETSNYLKILDKRLNKNTKVQNISKKDPIRIYSNLIEYGDVTSIKTYNKLCALVTGKLNLESEAQKQKGVKQNKAQKTQTQDDQLATHLAEDIKFNKIDMNQLLFHAANTVQDVQQNYEQGGQTKIEGNIFKQERQAEQQKQKQKTKQEDLDQSDFELDEENVTSFRKLEMRNSMVGNQLMQLVMENQEKITEAMQQNNENKDDDDEFEFAKIISNEKEFHQNQVNATKKKIEQQQKELEEMSEELYELKEKEKNIVVQIDENKSIQEELQNTQDVIKKKIDSLQKNSQISKDMEETQKLVLQKSELEDRKQEQKKQIKEELAEYEKQKEKAGKDLPKFDENYQKQLIEEVAHKKEKYDKKFKDLAQVNKDLSVVQRKMESFPSPTEIAQYHQRFMELIDNINTEMERQRDYLILYNNSQSVKDMVVQFVEIMRTFKENYNLNRKSKSGREKFVQELTATFTSLQNNQIKALEAFNKQKQSKEQKTEQQHQLQALEREYFKYVKQLNIELEKSEYLMSEKQ